MVQIPENTTPMTTIAVVDAKQIESELREYLSMSSIGNSCMKKLWMNFRWCTKKILKARTSRIFERGNIEEARIIRDLKAAGCYVYKQFEEDGERIEMTGVIGEEQEELIGFAGHAKGHPDGRIIGLIEAPKTPHLLEMKTTAEKYFNAFIKKGLQESWPVYYDQMQMYMGNMKLKRGYFIVTNKNNEEREAERVYFDKDRYQILVEKERSIILSEFIPATPYKPSWYECRYCDHKFSCHKAYYDKFGEGKEVEKNCRTCRFADLGDNGSWSCSMQDDKELSKDDQLRGCLVYKIGIYEE